jgi:NTE family protein
MTNPSQHIGIALSSGGAAGLAHVGVVEALSEAGIAVGHIAGTSAGAAVGAAFAADRLDGFRDRFLAMTRRQRMRFFDPTWAPGGLFSGRRGMDFIRPFIGDSIENLARRFAAIATDLSSGRRIVIRNGAVEEAVRASVAIPGILTPVVRGGRLLVDGALVDPIPVEAVRELGASFVIAVSVIPPPFAAPLVSACCPPRDAGWLARTWRSFTAGIETNAAADPADDDALAVDPGSYSLSVVLTRASVVMQSHIAAARMREQRPDFLIQPDVRDIGVFDFDCAAKAIEAGRAAANAALPALRSAIEDTAREPRTAALRRLIGGGQAA